MGKTVIKIAIAMTLGKKRLGQYSLKKKDKPLKCLAETVWC